LLLEEIIKETGISRNSLFKIWKKLEEYNIVMITRKTGKSSMYVLNDENEIVQQLLRLELILGKIAMEKAAKGAKPIPV
jgi:DNA-binding transcriptional regulator GbsR (MarR family)